MFLGAVVDFSMKNDILHKGKGKIKLIKPATVSAAARQVGPGATSGPVAFVGQTGLTADGEATLLGLCGDTASLLFELVEFHRVRESAKKVGHENVKYGLRSGYENLQPGGATSTEGLYDLVADLNLAATPEPPEATEGPGVGTGFFYRYNLELAYRFKAIWQVDRIT